MFEVERKRFESVVRAMSVDNTIRVVRMTLKPTHICAANIDEANVVMSYVKFPKHFFVRYDVSEVEDIAFDAERVLKILKSVKGDIVKVEKEGDELQLSTDKERVSVPLMEQSETRLPNFVEIDESDNLKIKGLHPSVKVRVPALKKELESLGIERTTFTVDGRMLYVEQSSEDGYKFSTKIAEVGSVEDGSYMFDTNYLKKIFGSVIMSEVVVLLGKDCPLIVVDRTNDYTLNFFLARLVMGEEIGGVEEVGEGGEIEDEITKELLEEGAD